MNEFITKPMSVLRQEFIDKIIDNINESQLPMFIIEPILQDVLSSVRSAAQEQYMSDKKQYEQKLAALAAQKDEPKVG